MTKTNIKTTLWSACAMLLSTVMFAQQNAPYAPTNGGTLHKHSAPTVQHRTCGQPNIYQSLSHDFPDVQQRLQQLQQGIEVAATLSDDAQQRSPTAVIEIPVVFHVIHSGEAVGAGRNISTARLTAQLALLNSDIRKLNANFSSGTPAIFQGVAADAELHFCFAKTDPNGVTTTGIDRAQMTDPVEVSGDAGSDDTNNRIKLARKWDPTRYLNIYVLAIPGTSTLGGVIGYSYLPFAGLPGATQDGIVLDYRWVGGPGSTGYAGGGRSLTHELGHYLGLPHIWANTSNTGGCSADDGIADTPEQNDATSNNASFFCSSGVPPVSCGTQNMYVNYMDYLDDDDCYTMFTTGQKNVMRAVLQGTASSFGLASRTALVNNGLTQCSACTMTVTTTSVNASCTTTGSATATPVSVPSGQSATYTWSNGSTTATASGLAAGTYTVTVVAGTSCQATATATVLNPCTSFCDTLSNYNLAIDSARLYSAGTGLGFVSGNNNYGDKAKADYFDYSTGANTHLRGVFVGFGKAKDTGTATNINLRVWNANGTGGVPNTILATKSLSLTTLQQNVAAQQYLQYYQFDPPIALPTGKKIFIGVELPTTTGDTLALITNQVGAMAAGAGTAWELGSANTWHNYNDATNGWGIDVAHLIAPVLGTPTVANVTPLSTTIACGQSVTFNSTTSTNAAARTWAFTGGNITTSTAVSPVVTYAAAGNYTALLTTTNDCMQDSAIVYVHVTCATCTLVATTTKTNTTCGLANGTATAVGTGGTTPYTYAWSNGGTTATISNLAAATYTVTVTAGAGCTKTATRLVAASTAITLTGAATATTCALANGAATVTATGGSGTYTYAWSNGGTTATISNLAAATYTVTVTGGAGCTKTATRVVATSTALTATTATTPTTCATGGTATATPTGSTSPYTYAWSNGSTTATVSNLAAATYTVTITSAVGCTLTKTATVANGCVTCNMTVALQQTAICNGVAGTISSNVTAAPVSPTYLWSTGATTANISSTVATTYTVTVTAGAGCSRTATITLINNTPIISAIGSSVACNGSNNGDITVTVVAPANVSIIWSNGGTSANIVGVAAGTYTVTVSATGTACSATATAVVTQPTQLTATVTTTPATGAAADGTATVVASGGTTPYTYAWSGGGNTPTITQLAAGIYTVTVTDTNLCTYATVVTVGTVVGTRGIGNLHNLLLYPNPTTGKTLVLGDFGQPTDLTVRLTNTIGQTMLTQNLANVTHLYLPLDLSMYAEGVYFVTLQTADGQVIRKVILTR